MRLGTGSIVGHKHAAFSIDETEQKNCTEYWFHRHNTLIRHTHEKMHIKQAHEIVNVIS